MGLRAWRDATTPNILHCLLSICGTAAAHQNTLSVFRSDKLQPMTAAHVASSQGERLCAAILADFETQCSKLFAVPPPCLSAAMVCAIRTNAIRKAGKDRLELTSQSKGCGTIYVRTMGPAAFGQALAGALPIDHQGLMCASSLL